MRWDSVHKRLDEARSNGQLATYLATPNKSSVLMSDILALPGEDFETLVLVSILRVVDCLICYVFYVGDMNRMDKASYQELARQELVSNISEPQN